MPTRRPAPLDALDEQLCRQRAERLGRLLHRGQEGVHPRRVLDVVETDEGDVVGDLEPRGAHRFDRAQRDEIVDGENRRGTILQLEQAAHSLGASAGIDRGFHDERWIQRDPGRFERRLVAAPPVARGRDGIGFGDHPDSPVAERDQVLDELLCPAGAVAEDRVGVDA